MTAPVLAGLLMLLASAPLASAQSHVHQPPSPPPSEAHDPHAGHAAPEVPVSDQPAPELPPHIPEPTDADRAAAFPDVQGHSVHDNAINSFVLVDQLEWQSGHRHRGLSLDVTGWVGRDRDRLWFRAEGDGSGRALETGQADLLYGRAIARWWDVVVGVRQDVRPGPAQTWAAVGIQGLAPYWFEVDATAYIGAAGRAHVRLEAEYQLLLTNRLILQPLVEAEVYTKTDPEHGAGAGLTTVESGLRLRYEFRRRVAPYVGVVWHRKFFGTADLARAAGDPTRGARLALGLRLWM